MSYRKFYKEVLKMVGQRRLTVPAPSSIKLVSTESFKYYARPQTAVARGLDLPTSGLAGRQTATASKHSLCYFSLFSE